MAITLFNSQTTTSGGSTVAFLNLSVPSGAVDGDLILFVAGSDDTTTTAMYTSNANFTVMEGGDGGSDCHLLVGYWVRDGSTPLQIPVYGDGNDEMWGHVFIYRGVDPLTPLTWGSVAPAIEASAVAHYYQFSSDARNDFQTDDKAMRAMSFDGGDSSGGTFNWAPAAGWTKIIDIFSGTSGNDASGTIGERNTQPPVSSQYISTGTRSDGSVNIGWILHAKYAALSSTSFRGYEDGTESGSIALEAADVDIEIPLDTPFSMRWLIQEIHGFSETADFRIMASKNTAPYFHVSTTSTIEYYDSANLTHTEFTTQRIGLGTFVAGRVYENLTSPAIALTANDETELLSSLYISSASSLVGDTFDLKIVEGSSPYNDLRAGSIIVRVTIVAPIIEAVHEQDGFRFYDDDGSESTATPLAAIDTNIEVDSGVRTDVLLRVLVAETAGGTQNLNARAELYLSENSGVYNSTWSTDVVRFNSTNLTHLDPTTQQIGAGTFNEGEIHESNQTALQTFIANQENEYLYTVAVLDTANVGDTFDFRINALAGTDEVLDAWNVTARITVIQGAVPKNATDSGSGSETVSADADVSATDTGSGADTATLSSKDSALVDSGAGADAVDITALVDTQDSGSGVDLVSVEQQIPKSTTDSGSGSDSVSMSAGLSTTDSGAGADTPPLTASLDTADTGAGTETASIIVTLTTSDIGAGASVVSRIISETKNAVDSGSGSDIVSVSVSLNQTDSGAGTDTLSLSAALTLSDSATAADIVNVTTATFKTATDSGLGTDDFTLTVSHTLTDSGAGTDQGTLAASDSIADSGASIDSIAYEGSYTVTDSGTGVDSVLHTVSLTITDQGSGLDILNLLTQELKTATDSGSGIDSVSIVASLSLDDTATGVDSLLLIADASKSVSEAGSGIDTITLEAAVNATDSGTGADSSRITANLSTTDSAIGVDLITGIILALSESGAGQDSMTLGVAIPVSDSGAGADLANLIAVLSVTDSATGAEVTTRYIDGDRVHYIEFAVSKKRTEFAMTKASININLI